MLSSCTTYWQKASLPQRRPIPRNGSTMPALWGRAGGRGRAQTELAPRSGAALDGCCRRAHLRLAASSQAPPPAQRRCSCTALVVAALYGPGGHGAHSVRLLGHVVHELQVAAAGGVCGGVLRKAALRCQFLRSGGMEEAHRHWLLDSGMWQGGKGALLSTLPHKTHTERPAAAASLEDVERCSSSCALEAYREASRSGDLMRG
jgi:hypothetical protein